MKILSIETSCDETALSIINASGDYKRPIFSVLANNIASQIALHAKYGGVFPMMARREHAHNICPLFITTLKDSKNYKKRKNIEINLKKEKELKKILEREPEILKFFQEEIPYLQKPKIDLISVTSGPGLEPALWVGITFAKALAYYFDIPIIPTNHMEGHVLSILIQDNTKNKKLIAPKIQFPTLALLISGGHTELVLMKDWMKYKILGSTRDDAVGEAFDKVARMLGLPYPGGPEISKLAKIKRKGDKEDYKRLRSATARVLSKNSAEFYADSYNLPFHQILPRPMIHSKDFDFSFSGLKTAVLYLIRDLKKENIDVMKNQNLKEYIAMEFENAVTDVLVFKTLKAIEKYEVKTLIVAGGVASNTFIKENMESKVRELNKKINVYFPKKELATDNSLMIGIASYFNFLKKKRGVNYKTIKAVGNIQLK